MRTLARARLLWSDAGALPIDSLPELASASAAEVDLAVERLCAEGIAELSPTGRLIRLTARGAHDICDRRSRTNPV
jgi:hypothetical protein